MFEVPAFDDAEIATGFLETSKYSVIYPTWRASYILENFEKLQNKLQAVKLHLQIDKDEKMLFVSTTAQTRDPYIILKGRDLIGLVSRGMDIKDAEKVLRDTHTCEIIDIFALSKPSKKDVFVNRRQRLLGKNEQIKRALELLTNTKILVSGKTLSVVGRYSGVNKVYDVVQACFKNFHPVYLIRELIAKKELEKDPKLKDVDWDRYLPPIKIKTKNKKESKKLHQRNHRNADAIPDADPKRMEDLEALQKSHVSCEDKKSDHESDNLTESNSECDQIITQFLQKNQCDGPENTEIQ